jgi:hypothetical protein
MVERSRRSGNAQSVEATAYVLYPKRKTKTWVERFNVQGSGLMNPNRLNPK